MRWIDQLHASSLAVVGTLAHVRVSYAVAALLLYTGSLFLAAFRWRLVLRGLGGAVNYWRTLLAYLAGVCMGNITPARTVGGDACRIAALGATSQVPLKTVAASVVIERLTEALPVTALVLMALSTLRPGAGHGRWILAIAALLLAAAYVFRSTWHEWLQRWRAAMRTNAIAPRTLAAVTGCSTIVWLQDAARLALVAAACGVALTPAQAATLSVVSIVSGIVPTIGGLGVVEGGLVAALVVFGASLEVAVAVTAIERAISFAFGTALGGVALGILGARRIWPKRVTDPLVLQ